jgi:hypothetical protein
MANNTLITRSGVNVYNNRTLGTAAYTAPNRFRVSISTPDVVWTDTTLTTTVPLSGTETVSDCSVTTGWTASGTNSVSTNALTYKPDSGTNGALNLVKSDTSSATVSVSKSTTSVAGTSKDFTMWIYIKDSTALAKLLSAGPACVIRFGTDASNYYYLNLTAASFAVGWNFVKAAISSGFTGTTGSPTIGTLAYTYIAFVTNNTSDTFAATDLVYDAIRVASADDYYKTTDSVTLDETDGAVTVVSKLTVTEANGFLLDGHALFNTDSSELLFEKTKFPSNSKDNVDLFRITTKLKIRNLNQ